MDDLNKKIMEKEMEVIGENVGENVLVKTVDDPKIVKLDADKIYRTIGSMGNVVFFS